jgi:hypothetical protein
MLPFRRLRGALLRIAYRRSAALLTGLLLVSVAAVLAAIDRPWESWITDGLTLVCGATGVALVLIALSGRTPDWIDPE